MKVPPRIVKIRLKDLKEIPHQEAAQHPSLDATLLEPSEIMPPRKPDPSGTRSKIQGEIFPARPESLPVLAAFQEFLEQERKRARRGILALTALSLALVAFVLCAGFFAGMIILERMALDFSNIQKDLLAFESRTLDLKETTRSALTTLAADVAGQVQLGASERERINSRINELRNIIAALGTAQPAPDGLFVHNPPGTTDARGENEVGESAAADVIVMSILPRGSNRHVLWRVPIPE